MDTTARPPTQECFDANPLTFVRDELYGAPKDERYPERAYVAPPFHPARRNSEKPTFEEAMLFKYVMQLPPGLSGELVLLQWYYVAGNSGCSHAGYDDYPWPENWLEDTNGDGEISPLEAKYSVGIGLNPCEDILSEDGNGVPVSSCVFLLNTRIHLHMICLISDLQSLQCLSGAILELCRSHNPIKSRKHRRHNQLHKANGTSPDHKSTTATSNR